MSSPGEYLTDLLKNPGDCALVYCPICMFDCSCGLGDNPWERLLRHLSVVARDAIKPNDPHEILFHKLKEAQSAKTR